MLTKAKSAKDEYIETLRGLACLLLVAFHVVGADALDGMHVAPDGLWREISNALKPVRMPLFAFISGLVLVSTIASGTQLRSYLTNRLCRLGLPLLFVVPAFNILACGIGSRMCTAEPIYNLVMPYAHYWYLQTSILIAILLGIALYLLRSNYVRLALIGLPLSWLAFLFLGEPSKDVFSVSGVAYLTPFVLLGVAAREFRSQLLLNKRYASLFLGFVAALIYAENWHAIVESSLPGNLLRTPVYLILSSFIMLTLLSLRLKSGLLVMIGQFAFSIYLFHPIFTGASRRVLIWSGFEETGLPLFAFDLLAGIALPIALQSILLKHRLTGLLFLGERFSLKQTAPVAKTA